MALDIREGDYLTVEEKSYPIRACAEWAWDYGRGMRRLCKVEASTKRRAKTAGGRAGEFETIETDLLIMPLDPASSEIARRLGTDAPHELLVTYANGGNVFYELTLEDLKR